MSTGSVQCKICGLPRFYGATGYVGPQCTCHFVQPYPTEPASEEDMKIYKAIAEKYFGATMTPSPSQIQQVIEHLDSLGFIVCKKGPVAKCDVAGRLRFEDGVYEVRFGNCPQWIEVGTALYSAAPAYAMRNAAEKGGE